MTEEAQGISFADDEDVAASFSADTERRTIAGIVVPWGKVARSMGFKWKFAKGSLHWADTRRVKLNLDHDHSQPIAYASRLHNTVDGLEATFKVARGADGDKALALAEDGVLDGFSIEVGFDDGDGWQYDQQDESVRLVGKAKLAGVALTGFPAFDDARADRVAAARQNGGTMAEDLKDPQGVEEGAETFEAHLSALADRVAKNQEEFMAQFGQGVTDTLDASIRTTLENMGSPQGPETVRAARYSTLKEPSVYTFDGRGNSLVRDSWAAARDHDEDAIARLRKFRAQSEDMAEVVHHAVNFAPQTTTTAASLIPPGYRPDLYVSDLFKQRPLVSLASQGTIANASPFTVPKFVSVTGGSATHVEGTNPSDGALAFTPQVVTPQAISGRIVLTREIVDSSNPAIDQIAFAEMRESYERQTETIVYTLLNGASGAGGVITAGFVPSGAQAVTTAGGTDNQTLVKAIRKAVADYWFARFAPPTGAAMGQGATARLAQAVDTTQRPLFPWAGGQNAFGTANPVAAGYQVDSLSFQPAWAMTGVAAGDSQMFLVKSSDLWVWESPLLTFRFEEKQGPANIELNIFAYFGTALIRPVGLSGIRIT
jgi:HK97 family phage prohead protease